MSRWALSEDYNLEVLHPTLAQEWHPEKNGSLQPQQLCPNSPQKVWWRCSMGHEWQAKPNLRVSGHTGCPYCNHNRASPQNNVAVLFPQLIKEWHPTRNKGVGLSEILPGSGKKIWWLCSKGHEWKAVIKNRTRMGSGCPRCHSHVSQLELRLFTELSALFINVQGGVKVGGYECDILIPQYNLAIEIDGEYWHKSTTEKDKRKCQRLLEQGVLLIRVRELGLGLLSENDLYYKQREGHKSVVDRMLEKVKVVVPLSDTDLATVDSYLAGTCLLGDLEYQRLRLEGLPVPWSRSLASVPEVAASWHPEKNGLLSPENVYAHTGLLAWWECSAGHEWRASIQSRVSGRGCIRCAGKIATPERNLQTEFPHLASEWHPSKNGDAKPDSFTPYSNEKVWWLCSQGHEWQSKINNRAKGKGCPCCAGLKKRKHTSHTLTVGG